MKSPSRDVACQQTLLNVKRNTFSSRAWNLNNVRVPGRGWGRGDAGWGGGVRLDSSYLKFGILFLFAFALICSGWVFLEPYCSHHHKAFLERSSSFSISEKLSPFDFSLLSPWESSQMLPEENTGCTKAHDGWKPARRWGRLLGSLYFYCQCELRTVWLSGRKQINPELLCEPTVLPFISW